MRVYIIEMIGAVMLLVLVGAGMVAIVNKYGQPQEQPDLVCTNPCPNKTLVIEGCDKHGRNCAPIYICGGTQDGQETDGFLPRVPHRLY